MLADFTKQENASTYSNMATLKRTTSARTSANENCGIVLDAG